MSSHCRCHYLLSDQLRYIILCYCSCLIPVSEITSHHRCCYLMIYPLCAVILRYCPFPVPVYEMSSHYRCRYILSYPLHAIFPFPISQTIQIKIEPKDCVFIGKSLYIQFTPQLFSTVSIQNKVRYTSAPNSRKCTPSREKIQSYKPKR